MKIKIKYRDGMYFEGETPSGHLMKWDSGLKDAKTDGPTPMEAFLQATAVCGAMDVVSILKKRRKEIAFFEVDVEGERAGTFPKIFDNIMITYRIGGDSITQEEVQKAMKLSDDKYCSIINMMIPDVKVEYRVEMM